MPNYIRVKFRGLLMSFGGMSVSHKWRGTEPYPTISSVIGFLCSCLGVSFRRDLDRVKQLRDGIKVHIVLLEKARRIVDFQTAGTLYDKKDPYEKLCVVKKPGGGGDSDIYKKELLADGKFDVILEVSDPEEAERIIKALQKPVWTPFLGRKSNLLSELPYGGTFESWDEVLEHYRQGKQDDDGDITLIRQVPAESAGCFPVRDYPVCRGDNKTRVRFACEERI